MRDRETNRPLTQTESKLAREGLNREKISQTRFWRLRPDVIVFLPPTESKAGIFCILEFKRMSDITDQYLIRARSRAENQYASLRRALGDTIQRQGWRVEQISFIAGSRSLNEDDLRKNLKFFQVPEASIEAIGSKLALRIFDEYANILRCMYSTRYRGGPSGTGSSTEGPKIPETSVPFLIRSLESGRPDNFRSRGDRNRKGGDT